MKLLERLAAVAELDREPVEQLGVRRRFSHVAEVVERADQAPTKMVMPDPVHNGTPRERVASVRQPLRQRGTADSFVRGVRQREPRWKLLHAAECSRQSRFAWTADVAAMQHVNRSWSRRRPQSTVRLEVGGDRIDLRRLRQRDELMLDLLQLLKYRQLDALRIRTLLAWCREDRRDPFGNGIELHRRSRIRDSEPHPADQMLLTVELLENKLQRGKFRPVSPIFGEDG